MHVYKAVSWTNRLFGINAAQFLPEFFSPELIYSHLRTTSASQLKLQNTSLHPGVGP